MEVTRSNFLEVFPEILQKLETASFVSFDAEYTGLKGNDGVVQTLFNTTSQRYELYRATVLNNSVPQCGIAIFHRMRGPEFTTEQNYSVDAYCFYLEEPSFPGFNMENTKASVDIDCCQFLNGIRFDFNRWFTHAVPYLNQTKVQKLDKYLSENPNFLQGIKKDYGYLFGSAYPNGKTTESKVQDLKVKISDEERKDILQKCRGISAIVDVISRKKIPVVGHNMALDLMYFFHLFCKDLPENYEDFKSEVLKFLPKIYDTKYMTVRCRKFLDHPSLNYVKKDIDLIQCSGLFVIYKTSSAIVDKFSPKVSLSDTCSKFAEALNIGKSKDLEDEENSSLCHEPSFDACVTGLVFLNVAHIACRIDRELQTKDIAPDLDEVMKYILHWENQIFVARCSVVSICLEGDDPKPNRPWVRIVSQKSKASIDLEHILKELESDPEIKRQLHGIDCQQVSPNEVLMAVSRFKSVADLCEKLQKLGYDAIKVFPPWDKKRYEAVGENCTTDCAYDTRRNRYLS